MSTTSSSRVESCAFRTRLAKRNLCLHIGVDDIFVKDLDLELLLSVDIDLAFRELDLGICIRLQ